MQPINILEDILKSLESIHNFIKDNPKDERNPIMIDKVFLFTTLKLEDILKMSGVDLIAEYRNIINDFLPSPMEKLSTLITVTKIALKASKINSIEKGE